MFVSANFQNVSARTGGGQPKVEKLGQGEGGSKITTFLRTSFMDAPVDILVGIVYQLLHVMASCMYCLIYISYISKYIGNIVNIGGNPIHFPQNHN